MRSSLCIVFVYSLLGLLLAPVCDELLPARDDPVDFLTADIAAIDGIVVIRGGQAVGLSGSFFLTVENLYDEVLQGEAQVKVDITVCMVSNTSRKAVVSFDEGELLNDWILSGGQITIAPDTTAKILSQWDHSTTEGTPFWEFVQLTPKTTNAGEEYLESDPIRFIADASVQMFKNVNAEKTKLIQFEFTYWVFE